MVTVTPTEDPWEDLLPVPGQKTMMWADYLVLAFTLLGYVAIGLVQAFVAKKPESAKEFLNATGQMPLIPVVLSLLSSVLSAIIILGGSAEIYTQGAMYWLQGIGQWLATIVAGLLFVPLLYPLQLTSSYEGGMKSSIWVGAIQALLMLFGTMIGIIKPCIDHPDGIKGLWKINEDTGRLDMWNFDPNPLERHTFWTLVIGNMVLWTSTYGVNQPSVQRYCSVRSEMKGMWSVFLNGPGLMIFTTLCAMSGGTIFGWYYYVGCDPLEAGYIDNSNQVLPYYIMDRVGYPTIPGLFMAALFAGALSSMAGSLGALASCTWQDLLAWKLGHLSERKKTIINKGLLVLFTGVGIGFGFMVKNFGGTVLQQRQQQQQLGSELFEFDTKKGCEEPQKAKPYLHIPFFDRLLCCIRDKSLDALRYGWSKKDLRDIPNLFDGDNVSTDSSVSQQSGINAFTNKALDNFESDGKFSLTVDQPPPSYVGDGPRQRKYNNEQQDDSNNMMGNIPNTFLDYIISDTKL
ncbi:hypothetical protein LSH36_1275g00012 [Paralvinella palmiformis]|uniref:Sodium-coupled monocarboxylate transporter 1 n=1 Tax=Paralvinella palmiformis TaxID=53620 RepID=A0AAD9ITQ6_9ANNE|nr:hypothetical protein LSH36_1275g00012 [Paralvinella palmiformis]